MVQETNQVNTENVIKRKRGRPPKKVQETPVETSAIEGSVQETEKSVYPANMHDVQQISDLLPLTLGMILQQARHQQHLKLSVISKKLCIKETYLEALENGHYYVFPALVYGAGFLRSYARFLGLNADEMAARFQRETTGIKAESIDMPHTTDPRIIPNWTIIIKSLLGLFFLYLIWNIFQAVTEKPAEEIALPVIETAIEIPETTNIEAPVSADEVAVPEAVETKVVEPETPPPEPPKPVQKPKEGTSYGLKKPARVSFWATDTVKIEIRDTEAESVIFQQTLKAGDRYNPIEQADGLVLSTTNAGGLDVYVDGKKVRTLGKKGQTKSNVAMDAKSLMKD